MKGFIGEMLTFVIIIISIMILVFFFTNERVTKGGEVEKSIMVKEIKKNCNLALISLSNTKVDRVGRTVLETLVDATYNPGNSTMIYYGDDIMTVKVEETIHPILDKIIGENHWLLRVSTPADSVEYGNSKLKKNFIEKCYILTPVPSDSGETGKVILYVG